MLLVVSRVSKKKVWLDFQENVSKVGCLNPVFPPISTIFTDLYVCVTGTQALPKILRQTNLIRRDSVKQSDHI